MFALFVYCYRENTFCLCNIVCATPPPSLQQHFVKNIMDCNQTLWRKSYGDGIAINVNQAGILN